MADPLHSGSGPDPFAGFDAAPGPDSFDLTGFDAATGRTTVPQSVYVCRIERGEVVKTKAGKPAYRLCFKIVAPTEHAGFTVWKWLVMGDKAGFERARKFLDPLGFKSADDLRRPFPPIGRDVFVKALVTLKAATDQYPESNDVQRFEPCDLPDGLASSTPTLSRRSTPSR